MPDAPTWTGTLCWCRRQPWPPFPGASARPAHLLQQRAVVVLVCQHALAQCERGILQAREFGGKEPEASLALGLALHVR